MVDGIAAPLALRSVSRLRWRSVGNASLSRPTLPGTIRLVVARWCWWSGATSAQHGLENSEWPSLLVLQRFAIATLHTLCTHILSLQFRQLFSDHFLSALFRRIRKTQEGRMFRKTCQFFLTAIQPS